MGSPLRVQVHPATRDIVVFRVTQAFVVCRDTVVIVGLVVTPDTVA